MADERPVNEVDPLAAGTAALALHAALLNHLVTTGQMPKDVARDVVQHAVRMMADYQRADVERVYRIVLPGLF